MGRGIAGWEVPCFARERTTDPNSKIDLQKPTCMVRVKKGEERKKGKGKRGEERRGGRQGETEEEGRKREREEKGRKKIEGGERERGRKQGNGCEARKE